MSQNFRPHYNVYLQSIAVNGQILPIDSSVFSTSTNKGTIIDTGTTLAYLAEGAYDPFVEAVSFGSSFSFFSYLGHFNTTKLHKLLSIFKQVILSKTVV